MGLEEKVAKPGNTKDNASQTWTLCTHAFYDLTHVSPVVFMFLLKEYYYYGMISSPFNASNCCLKWDLMMMSAKGLLNWFN